MSWLHSASRLNPWAFSFLHSQDFWQLIPGLKPFIYQVASSRTASKPCNLFPANCHRLNFWQIFLILRFTSPYRLRPFPLKESTTGISWRYLRRQFRPGRWGRWHFADCVIILDAWFSATNSSCVMTFDWMSCCHFAHDVLLGLKWFSSTLICQVWPL